MQKRKPTWAGNFFLRSIATAILTIALLHPFTGQGAGTVTNLNWLDLQDALATGGLVRIECDGVIYKQHTNPTLISSNAVIDATGRNVILDGWSGWGGQLFSVASNVTLTLSNLTLANCVATTNGGVVANYGNLSAYNCVFSNNWAQGLSGTNGANGADVASGTAGNGTAGTAGLNCYGGAIFNQGILVINGGGFWYNAALGGIGGSGGSGGNSSSGTPGNGAAGAVGGSGFGGAIYSTNSVAITNCMFAGNYALGARGGHGGNGGVSPTLAGSSSVGAVGGEGSGAGLYISRSATVINSTFLLQIAGGGNGGNNGYTYGVTTTAGPAGTGAGEVPASQVAAARAEPGARPKAAAFTTPTAPA